MSGPEILNNLRESEKLTKNIPPKKINGLRT